MNYSSFESVFITVFLCYCAIIALSQLAETLRVRFTTGSSPDDEGNDQPKEYAATRE